MHKIATLYLDYRGVLNNDNLICTVLCYFQQKEHAVEGSSFNLQRGIGGPLGKRHLMDAEICHSCYHGDWGRVLKIGKGFQPQSCVHFKTLTSVLRPGMVPWERELLPVRRDVCFWGLVPSYTDWLSKTLQVSASQIPQINLGNWVNE